MIKALEKIGKYVGKYMALIVVLVTALGLLAPGTLTWIKSSWINTLLGIVMFGMGLTLKLSDFKVVFTQPRGVIFATILRFTVTPLIALGLANLFGLSPELTVGFILVAVCPGGTSSNVMTYLAKADVAMSVGMTAVSTLLSPILTPLLCLLFAGQRVEVDFVVMALSIVKVVLAPVVLGFLFNKFIPKVGEKLEKVLPLVSVVAIVMIVGSVVSANAAKIISSGFSIIAVVALLNMSGYVTGSLLGKILRYDVEQRDAIAIETAMQNSGLATSLATTSFAAMPMAAIPGAIFSVWHNVFGSVIANLMSARTMKLKAKREQISREV